MCLSGAIPPNRLETVQVTGDIATDCEELKKIGEIDAYFDIGPPQGCATLMGEHREDVALPHVRIMQRKIKLYSKWMYERDIPDLIKLVEHGMLKIAQQGGSQVTGRFPLERWRGAWDMAVEEAGFGKTVVIQH